jgi:hypothetical protein
MYAHDICLRGRTNDLLNRLMNRAAYAFRPISDETIRAGGKIMLRLKDGTLLKKAAVSRRKSRLSA